MNSLTVCLDRFTTSPTPDYKLQSGLEYCIISCKFKKLDKYMKYVYVSLEDESVYEMDVEDYNEFADGIKRMGDEKVVGDKSEVGKQVVWLDWMMNNGYEDDEEDGEVEWRENVERVIGNVFDDEKEFVIEMYEWQMVVRG